MRNLRSILLWTAFLVLLPLAAFAEDGTGGSSWGYALGAGLAIGLAGLGCGIGQGLTAGNTTAGIVWGNKFVHTTWWTENPREVMGINLLPITAASLYLAQDPAGIRHHLAGMERDFQRFRARGGKAPADIWQDILLPYLALADPAAALRAWDPQGAVEDGETRTHTWHWLQSLQGLGLPRGDLTADTPLFAVFGAAPGPVTYLAYNASATPRSVRFSDGTVMRVAARSLGQHRVAAAAKAVR